MTECLVHCLTDETYMSFLDVIFFYLSMKLTKPFSKQTSAVVEIKQSHYFMLYHVHHLFYAKFFLLPLRNLIIYCIYIYNNR